MTDNAMQVIGRHLMAREDRLQKVLSKKAKKRGINARMILRQMSHALRENDRLQACTPESLLQVCEEACLYGMTIGGPLPEAYVVPYKRQAKLLFGYRGLIRLIIDSGAADEVGVEFVYEGDVFRREMGIGGQWVHEAATASDREQRPITHVYSEFRLPDGHIKRWAMTREEIEEHKLKFAQGLDKADSPWNKSWKAMAAKTVLRQPIVRGIIPIRPDLLEVIDDGAEVDAGEVIFDVAPAKAIEDARTEEAAPPVETVKSVNLEELQMDLATSKTEQDVEEVRSTYLDGLAGPEAATVKQLCVERVQQLLSIAK